MSNISGSVFPVLCRLEVAPVTGSTTVLQAPYDHLLFTNAGTIAAQTVNLPAVATATDGQMLVISNVSIITSMTFSPAVTGFANTGTLAAGQGITLCYSAALGAWFSAAF